MQIASTDVVGRIGRGDGESSGRASPWSLEADPPAVARARQGGREKMWKGVKAWRGGGKSMVGAEE